MSRLIIGIDNGLEGGLVALSDHPGPPVSMVVMPTRSKPKGNEVDVTGVMAWINSLETPFSEITAILENPGKFSIGKFALCSMHDSYGALRGILEACQIRHHRIEPQKWQKSILTGCAKGGTKPAALAIATRLWPAEKWLATPRCKKLHDGLIDAALIAEYGRREKL